MSEQSLEHLYAAVSELVTEVNRLREANVVLDARLKKAEEELARVQQREWVNAEQVKTSIRQEMGKLQLRSVRDNHAIWPSVEVRLGYNGQLVSSTTFSTSINS